VDVFYLPIKIENKYFQYVNPHLLLFDDAEVFACSSLSESDVEVSEAN
jgi:hypothetical protein